MKHNGEVMSRGEIVLYQAKNGKVNVEANLQHETVWLSLTQMSILFGRHKSAISRHLHNIFKTKELDENSVVANFATTATDGKIYQVDYYNLDAIISVGYRVNSTRATQFRIWATSILKKHLIEGYTLNEKRLREHENKIHNLQKAIAIIKNKKRLEYKEMRGLVEKSF